MALFGPVNLGGLRPRLAYPLADRPVAGSADRVGAGRIKPDGIKIRLCAAGLAESVAADSDLETSRDVSSSFALLPGTICSVFGGSSGRYGPATSALLLPDARACCRSRPAPAPARPQAGRHPARRADVRTACRRGPDARPRPAAALCRHPVGQPPAPRSCRLPPTEPFGLLRPSFALGLVSASLPCVSSWADPCSDTAGRRRHWISDRTRAPRPCRCRSCSAGAEIPAMTKPAWSSTGRAGSCDRRCRCSRKSGKGSCRRQDFERAPRLL